MQSYDGFGLIPNFYFIFSSKAMDKKPNYGQIEEIPPISVHVKITLPFVKPKS